jgi:hypothetical protein
MDGKYELIFLANTPLQRRLVDGGEADVLSQSDTGRFSFRKRATDWGSTPRFLRLCIMEKSALTRKPWIVIAWNLKDERWCGAQGVPGSPNPSKKLAEVSFGPCEGQSWRCLFQTVVAEHYPRRRWSKNATWRKAKFVGRVRVHQSRGGCN